MNIAIIRRNGLGDLLCAVPLIHCLKEIFPDASRTLFVDARNAPLIPYLPQLAEVIVFPQRGNKYVNLLKAALAHRKRFDLAISAKTSPMKLMNFFLYALQAKERIAYVDRSWHAKLINRPIVYDPQRAGRLHQALKCLHLMVPELEDVPSRYYPKLMVPEAVSEKYPISCTNRHCRVLISVTTTLGSNRFDPERYATLLNRLYRFAPFSTCIVGQKADRAKAEFIASRLQMEHALHFPRNFDEFMVLLDRSDLFFVADGGAAHIGAALEKRVVVLFGNSNPLLWRPLGNKVETFYHPEHVDRLSDRSLLEALKRGIEDIYRGRNDL